VKTSFWHTLTLNSYLKTNSLASKNSFSFSLFYVFNWMLTWGQVTIFVGEGSISAYQYSFLSLHCNFNFPHHSRLQWISCLVIACYQRDLVVNIMKRDLFCSQKLCFQHQQNISSKGPVQTYQRDLLGSGLHQSSNPA